MPLRSSVFNLPRLVNFKSLGSGEVAFFVGLLNEKTCRKRQKTKGNGNTNSVAQPQLTKAMQNHPGLHRHATVRTKLFRLADTLIG